MTKDQYRQFVVIQYLNASTLLYEGLKAHQGKNDFEFVVSLRSFIEYTRRGIWFLAWATDSQVHKVQTLTFDRSGSPGLVEMDKLINHALGLGNRSALESPIKDINNEKYVNCLHALTHGNPISVRMVAFGIDKIFQTDKLLIRAETDLNLFRILLCRRLVGEELKSIWKMLSGIYNQPDIMRSNTRIAATLVQKAGLKLEAPKLGI